MTRVFTTGLTELLLFKRELLLYRKRVKLRFLTLIFLSFITIFILGGHTPLFSQVQATGATISSSINGFDWSLPDSIQPLWGYGLGTTGSLSQYSPHKLVTLDWQTLNPQKGVYNWNPVTSELNKAKNGNYGVVFRLKSNSLKVGGNWPDPDGFIPQWAVNEQNPRTFVISPHTYAAPWDMQAPYKTFITAFGQQKFHENKHFFGMYIHGISNSSGEEWSIGSANIAPMEAVGMTPEVLEDTFEERISAWANAFGSYKYKLMWVGGAGIFSKYGSRPCLPWHPTLIAAICTIGDRIADHARQTGIGIRGGFLENHFYHIEPMYATYLDEKNYLGLDENFGWFDNRMLGDEVEEYARDGYTGDARAYMLRVAYLRALQMRVNFLWMDSSDGAAAPAEAKYYNRVAGRTIENTPDAFSLLQEGGLKTRNNCYIVKNFERWLFQRDAPGFETSRTRFYQRQESSADCDSGDSAISGFPSNHGSFTSRKTSTKMGFFVDPRFVTQPNVEIKITHFQAASPARWRIDYCTPSGAVASTPSVTEVTNGGLKTTTFSLPDFASKKCLGNQFDFAVVAENGEVIVEMARIVKDGVPVNPTPTPSPSASPSPSSSPSPSPSASTTPSTCTLADLNHDKIVDVLDYLILVPRFLSTDPDDPADINRDGIVDVSDYSLLVSVYLQEC